jgi:hypothetical protein
MMGRKILIGSRCDRSQRLNIRPLRSGDIVRNPDIEQKNSGTPARGIFARLDTG